MNEITNQAAAGGASESTVIVVGNEKGGTGKSTTAMHVIVGLIRDGFSVGSMDLDGNQATLTRYFENRKNFSETKSVRLPMPDHHLFVGSELEKASDAAADSISRLETELDALMARNDFVVIDCPGANSPVARHAISLADFLITPVNDSFIDIDLLAKVGGTPPKVIGPSLYSQIVWEQRQQRAKATGKRLDWIVLRNRVSPLESRNKRSVGAALQQLSHRIGFTLIDGFYERVIFRQLFLQGLTVLDLRQEGTEVSLNMSHVAARREIRRLIDAVTEGEGLERTESESAAPGGREAAEAQAHNGSGDVSGGAE